MNIFNDCQWRKKSPKRMSVNIFYDTLWIAFQLQFWPRELPFAWLIADRWLPFTWRGWFSNRTLKKTLEKLSVEFFWFMVIKYSYGSKQNLSRFLFNENALNNIKHYQNFHKTNLFNDYFRKKGIIYFRKIALTVHDFKLDLILPPFFERSG